LVGDGVLDERALDETDGGDRAAPLESLLDSAGLPARKETVFPFLPRGSLFHAKTSASLHVRE
jgi:hypothetical protein